LGILSAICGSTRRCPILRLPNLAALRRRFNQSQLAELVHIPLILLRPRQAAPRPPGLRSAPRIQRCPRGIEVFRHRRTGQSAAFVPAALRRPVPADGVFASIRDAVVIGVAVLPAGNIARIGYAVFVAILRIPGGDVARVGNAVVIAIEVRRPMRQVAVIRYPVVVAIMESPVRSEL